jgi:hypothetical protein
MTRHTAPSTIGLDTFARSGGAIPQAFLENAGVAAPIVAAQASLRGQARIYPSVFIVGSTGDSELAGQLRTGLRSRQIPCWNIAADDEVASNSGVVVLAHSVYYDRLVLLCTGRSLENSQTSQYFSELAGSQRSGSQQTITVLATDGIFYQRNDRLCTILKEGPVLDFRGWEDAEVYQQALASLVQTLSGARA